MRAGVETLCTVASMEEKPFVLLDLGELVSQTFNLPTPFQPDPSDVLGLRTCLGWRYQRRKSCNLGQHPSGPHSVDIQRNWSESIDLRRCSSSPYLISLGPNRQLNGRW